MDNVNMRSNVGQDGTQGEGYFSNLVNGIYDDGFDDLIFSTPLPANHQHNDMSFEVPEDDVEVQQTNVGNKKGHSKRQKKISPNEDVLICSGWLNVGKDPINRVNQNGRTFWGRVLAYFNQHKESDVDVVRSENSLMHRWLMIQREVNKFCGVYEQIIGRPKSGATIQDMVTDAIEMYPKVDDEKKQFSLMHCYNRLKDEDKWKARRAELANTNPKGGNKNKKQKTAHDSTLAMVQSNNIDGGTESPNSNSEERKRPPGNKKAKEAQRRGGGDASVDALDIYLTKKEVFEKEKEKTKEARFMALYELEKNAVEVEKQRLSLEEKKKLANEEKEIEANLLKQEHKIMSMDKRNLDNTQLEYYEMMQKKIISRRKEN